MAFLHLSCLAVQVVVVSCALVNSECMFDDICESCSCTFSPPPVTTYHIPQEHKHMACTHTFCSLAEELGAVGYSNCKGLLKLGLLC